MSNISFLMLIVAFVQIFSVHGQSTLGLHEANSLNSVTEMQHTILQEIKYMQNQEHVWNYKRLTMDDLLGLLLNNMTQILQRFSNRLEALDQNVQNGRESCEGLQLKVNSSQIESGLHLNNMTQILQRFSNRLEALDQNVQNGRESCEGLQLKVSSTQIEDLLSWHLNNMTQILQSFSNRLEAIDQNVQNTREFSEGLQLQFQNLSKLYEEEGKFLRSVDRKLEEHDQYSRNQSAPSTSAPQDFCGLVTWPRDCADIRKVGQNVSDVYQVSILGPGLMPVEMSVYCDMNSSNESWLIFQKRKDGSENFERTWLEYKEGFGNLRGEFWLGNNALHLLTSNRNYKLRIELEDFDRNKRFAEYTQFAIGSASDNYRLNISGYSGNAGDDMKIHNGQMFSTKDADHDTSIKEHCAQVYHGAWWYNHCHSANLNGLYLRGNHTSYADGIAWGSFRGLRYSLKVTEMKIAPRK